MKFRIFSILLAALFSLIAVASFAQDDSLNEADVIALTIDNAGPQTVDILAIAPGEDAVTLADAEPFEAETEGEVDVPPGTKIMVYRQVDPGAEAGEARRPFMTFTVAEAPAAQTMQIPDPRVLTPVKLTFENDISSKTNLHLYDANAENGVKTLATLDVGASHDYNVYPGTVFMARAVNGSLISTFQVGLEGDQKVVMSELAEHGAKTVPITVTNMTGVTLGIKQHFGASIVRIAAVEPWHHATVDVAVGAELRVETNGESVRLLKSHRVEDRSDQDILVSYDVAAFSDPNSVPTFPVERLASDVRTSVLGFLKNIEGLEASKPDLTGWVGVNNSDKPIWLSGFKEGSISNFKPVRANGTARVIGATGQLSVTWPGDIEPKDVTAKDLHLAIRPNRGMPRIIDLTPPEKAKAAVINEACRPLDLFQVNAFGNYEPLGRLSPNAGRIDVDAYEGTRLLARLAGGALGEGQDFWQGVLSGEDDNVLAVRASEDNAHDAILASRPPARKGEEPRTLIITNFTSRPIKVFQLTTSGAMRQMFDEAKQPIIIEAGTDFTLYPPEGLGLVFRRPNARAHRSEYGRYRVTSALNQEVEIGQLKAESREALGAWIRKEPPNDPSENAKGSEFLTIVKTGNSEQVSGSMNRLEPGSDSGMRFEGCLHGAESYGTWYPEGFNFTCDTPVIDANGVSQAAYGRYRMQVVNGEMEFSYGYCTEQPNRTSSWQSLPLHFDDMDPDTEGLTHGMMETAWAPPSFEWLGRGFNLLYADPMNYASTEEPRAHSKRPLFNFIFQDTQGRVGDSRAKSIFGVLHPNAGVAYSECSNVQKVVKTMADMHDFSSKAVSGSIGVPGIASFSLSKSHSEKNTAATGSENLYIMERCDVRMDQLDVSVRWTDQSLYDHMRQPLEASFREAVNNLPTEFGDGKALLNFIKLYGTHFSESVAFGGTFFAETKVNKETFQRGFDVSDGVGVEVSGTIKKVQLGGSYKQEDTEGRNGDNRHENSEYRKFSVGGNGSKIYDDWAKSITEKDQLRAPIQIQFREITDLLTPVFFPTDPDIGRKNRVVRNAIKQYYRQFAGVDLTTYGLEGLNKRDPRQICARMEALKVTSKTTGGSFSGNLIGSFVNSRGEKISNVSGTLGLGMRTDSPFRPDGFLAMAQGTDLITNFDFESDAGFGWVREYCTPLTTENYVWDGSLCLEGEFTNNDDRSSRWTGDCNFSPKLFSLATVERNIPTIVSDSFVTAESVVEYKIRIYVP
ncbi:MAC/perforin domain-containing protein [Marinovum sp. 2_MG-2023]|uniref:MAC/perforin domain-containing protein n=1 Tax=unclassified Marinovum TaxID=2647166 RepID=UPI0026E3F2E0|nr:MULTISPECIES: MAC/perforin domain-containing protein [unclassified Marinovum]MDO6729589.1 MAC/perforin domain-containing protein [Marinovum sp. 2_MG-2023]MDO6780257.1 MAC/perforin domain-containing protein [Marinovum sp. 1_MG-2023]